MRENIRKIHAPMPKLGVDIDLCISLAAAGPGCAPANRARSAAGARPLACGNMLVVVASHSIQRCELGCAQGICADMPAVSVKVRLR